MLATVSLAGFVAVSAGAQRASAVDTSAITVSWLNDNSAAAQYQPARPADDASGKLSDFKNLKVTVSQTSDLIDQAITVTATGVAATTGLGVSGSANNYLQIMQCWGDPAAATFRDNCAFGAWGNSGFDQGAAQAKVAQAGAGFGAYVRPDAVPFTSVYGESSKRNGTLNGLERFFNTSTSNEQDFVPIYDDSTTSNATSSEFNVQSAAAAPWLGCGDSSYPNGTKCWLVIVPRGTHSGDFSGSAASSCTGSPIVPDDGYGTVSAFGQVGSPLSSSCSFWDDRMVVPLTFLPVGSKCPEGAPEVGTNGSMLINAAMSSWQGAVCAGDQGSVFNLINTAGLLTRKQLLQGTTKLAFIGQPITAADDPSGQYLPSADIRYAPAVNAAISVGFLIERDTRVSDIKLTPRLVAKLLTQSYKMEVPAKTTDYAVDYLPNNPYCITQDPEFVALNKDVLSHVSTLCTASSSSLVLSGPAGDDAIQLLWQWIEADKSAAQWLQGTPDENGMVVNPYYLPASNPKALGGGLGDVDLATGPVDEFYKADQTAIPSDVAGLSLDSIAWSPFSNDFGGVATRVLNGDTQQATGPIADRTVSPPALFKAAPELAGLGKAVMGVTDEVDVEQFGLDAASLQLPNKPGIFVSPTDSAMEAAVSARATAAFEKPASGMSTVDFSKLGNGAYPLTTTVYAAVNIADSTFDQPARLRYAHLLDYVATTGQQPGTQRGQLPEGYAPLTQDQSSQTLQLAGILDGSVDPNPAQPADSPAPETDADADIPSANDDFGVENAATSPVTDANEPAVAVNAATTGQGQSGGVGSAALPQKQPAVRTAIGQAALGGSLGVGIAGMVAAPLLMRRKAVKP